VRAVDAAPRMEESAAGSRRRLPAFREGFVSRPQLVRRLLDAPGVSLTVIAAPAGYGKTTLLSEWAQADERPFVWVTFDDADNDPALLLAAIEQALDGDEPLDGAIHRAVATSSQRARTALPRLARSLERRRPFVLVLDDIHVLHEPASLEALRTVANHIPPGSQLAVASRTEPALPLGRLRAHRALTEIRARDLAMTSAEAAPLLGKAGLDLAPHEVETLVHRTEGWPAGLYLAAVSLRDQRSVSAALGRFGGDDPLISDYIRDEVLSHLAPDAVAFLTRTSVLDRLSGPVCDAVVERRGSARLLSELGRANLLLVPLDRKGEEYRCHGLLSGALRMELRRLEPYREPDLHRRASEWCAAHGDGERAIEHAIAGGDAVRAGDLLWANAAEYVRHGRNGIVQRWLGSFTRDEIAAHPALALTAAHSHLASGELDVALRWESAARRALHETPPRKRSAALEAGVAILRGAVARDGLVRMDKDAARARELVPEDSPARTICCLLAGVARHLTGDRDGAQKSLDEGVRRAAVAAPNIQTLCLAQLTLLAAEREDWESGVACAARASAQMQHYRLDEYPTSALVFAASAAVRARRGRIGEAQEDVRHARRLLGRLTDFIPWYEAETRIALARAALRLSDVVGARELLADASRLAQRVPDAIVLRHWIDDVDAQAEAVSASAVGGPASLTDAELRVLLMLPTYLSFREIASRLYVSANTIKTQAHAVYRKLDAASRSEAVERAAEIGLIEPVGVALQQAGPAGAGVSAVETPDLR
jgi:LuxR family transcriptional regulator, maltose regulon positive regulatory protein